MTGLLAPFVRAETYRSLLFAVSALPLAIVGCVVLVTGWAVVLCFSITPLVAPLLLGLALVVRWLAVGEAFLARELLGADVQTPRRRDWGRGFWRRAQRVLGDGAFWRQQAYVLLRVALGFPLAILLVSLLVGAAWLLALPITYRWLDDADVLARRVDTLPEALAFAPAGLLVLLGTAHLGRPLTTFWRPIAAGLLRSHATPMSSSGTTAALRRRALTILGAVVGGLGAVFTAVWLLTTPGRYFWPGQAVLPLVLALGITAWVFLVLDRPEIERRTGGSRALAIQLGISGVLWLYLVVQWLYETGTFWPGWVLLAFGIAAGIHTAIVFVRREYARSHHRIEELETTRAGAVDVQETELRRIERDLHDGAQARLVALGMSIGMAEEKLSTDPEGARQLLAEARTGAREALEELRDLARGIHPPILTDRGLDAAIRALAARTPLRVGVGVDLAERPRPPIETATYFVVAEALANAGKHAGAASVSIDVHVLDGMLVAEVRDDGNGGADPSGKGLTGLRRRVEALDGTLRVSSPPGGPTTIVAELPCES